ncbi:helix-turn-helix domain-containing protein [Paenarthrobacter sp. Z7-10]|uniref:helix-turn-helix domain-containing protein n=1 Tax=Paenarthrobacter sp. Z7-10 TaxID=2787635 RepID=UPI0022A964A7|nr:helix-turn-helix domain-containing protein [Paenarthrobacter sp. Z7-10]MCZ2402199.1 helix-turn-helix domain-containing protein [Paenarthrobacter sp. Z7-10]
MPEDDSSITHYLTVAELATATRLSKMTIYRLIHAGTLPAVSIGRSFRISQSAVDAYLGRPAADADAADTAAVLPDSPLARDK